MKTALITTTINVPKVLALYRKLGPDVAFFVAADEKTPLEAYHFCAGIPDCEIYSPDRQKELGYACSSLLGWNNDSRRNIALLEAVKWGADFIVSVDDDMVPMNDYFFSQIVQTLAVPYFGLQFGSPQSWFDAGRFSIPPVRQRGLPLGWADANLFSLTMDAPVGAMQGIILGVPDTDALTALTQYPRVTGATDILRNGFVVDPKAYSVFNSQLTAFRRELAPCFAQFYNWQGRNTDIFASLVMRRVMRERGLYTYFGPPMAFHARSQRDLFKDLQAEMYGLEHVAEFQHDIDSMVYVPTEKSVVEQARHIYYSSVIYDDMRSVAFAFLDDIEKIL